MQRSLFQDDGMSNASEPNESYEPLFLGRIRPIATIVFGLLVAWFILGFASALWDVLGDIWRRLPR